MKRDNQTDRFAKAYSQAISYSCLELKISIIIKRKEMLTTVHINLQSGNKLANHSSRLLFGISDT